MISLIIPTHQESASINDHLRAYAPWVGDRLEIILVDSPKEATLPLLDSTLPLKTLSAPQGRASQMNAGARIAQGEFLLFLHADTLLPKATPHLIQETLQRGYIAGSFSLGFDSPRLTLAILASLANLRTRFSGIPYGDQGLFVRQEDFWSVGGFPLEGFLEDVLLVQKLRARGKIAILKERVLTSPRRYEERGILRQALQNRLIMLLFTLGFSPSLLRRLY